MVLIARAQPFGVHRLRAALAFVFAGTTPPTAVPPPPRDWDSPYARLARQVGLDPDVLAAHSVVAHFLDPVLDGTAGDDDRWVPTMGRWERTTRPDENKR